MTEAKAKFTIIRYVPDQVRNEPKNIGVLLQVPERNYFSAKVPRKLGTLLEASESDVLLLKEYLKELLADHSFKEADQQYINTGDKAKLDPEYLNELSKRAIGKIHFAEPAGILTKDPEGDLENLFRRYVGEGSLLSPSSESPTRSRLKTSLKRDLARLRLLTTPRGAPVSRDRKGLQQDALLNTGVSGASYPVDFSYQNGKLLVVETVDFHKSDNELQRETFGAAFKLTDLMRGWKRRFEGFSVVSGVAARSKDKEAYLKMLRSGSKVVYYDRSADKEMLFGYLKRLIDPGMFKGAEGSAELEQRHPPKK